MRDYAVFVDSSADMDMQMLLILQVNLLRKQDE